MRPIDETSKEGYIFFDIYQVFHRFSPDLKLGDYYCSLLPFRDKPRAALVKDGEKYLIAYWKKGAGFNSQNHSIRQAFLEEIAALDPDDVTLRSMYAGNKLVPILHAFPKTGPEILGVAEDFLKHVNGPADSPSETLISLRAALNRMDYITFLILLLQCLFFAQKSLPQSTLTLDRLGNLLSNNNVKLPDLYDYTKNVLLRSGTKNTYGMLSILKKAGLPDNIQRSCSPFLLLEASDIFYYSRLNPNCDTAEKRRNMSAAYAYSEAAKESHGSPIAAWNMGFSWYRHGTGDIDSDIAFAPCAGKPAEEQLIRALEEFSFAAGYAYGDAFNSIGNICNYLVRQKLISRYDRLVSFLKSTTASLIPDLNVPAGQKSMTDETFLYLAQRCYELGRENGSLTAGINLYKLQLQQLDISLSNYKTYEAFAQDNMRRFLVVRMLMDEMCSYYVPDALIESAALSMHLHRLNAAVQTRFFSSSEAPEEEYSTLIYDYYQHIPSALRRELVFEKLDLASRISEKSFRFPATDYLLARWFYDEKRDYDKARKYLMQALDRNNYSEHRYNNSPQKEYQAFYNKITAAHADGCFYSS